MTIAKRLLVLILVSVISSVVLGVFALTQIKKVGDGGEYLFANTLPSYQTLYVAMERLYEVRALTNKHILYTEPEKMAEIEKDLSAAREDMVGKLAHYGKDLLTNDEDGRLWKAAQKDIQDYMTVVDETLQLSRAGNKLAARDKLASRAGLIAHATEELRADIAFNTRISEGIEKDYRKASAWAVGIIAAMLVGVILLSVILGRQTYRSVIGPLTEIRNVVTGIDRDLDFTLRAKQMADDEVGQTVRAFNHLVERTQNSLSTLRDRVGKVTSAAAALAASASQVSAGSTQQSESASSMAATVEQVTVSITHVADQTAEANRLSEQSGKMAEEGEVIINRTVSDINKIADTVRIASDDIDQLGQNSEQISTVIAVIREVAEQTNLLALNAAIEAARAGEQGRGFAVVADEVRKLAERTAQSTQEISTSIASMQVSAQSAVKGMRAVETHVASGVQQAVNANDAMHRIGEGARQTVSMVSDISHAIREQSVASNSIAQQVERIAQMTEENSAAAQSTATTAAELDRVAVEMQGVVAQFKL